MSSIPTRSQQQTFLHQSVRNSSVSGKQKKRQFATGKRQHFIRSASIERIIQFNAYICSQNFFILPALIAWLKTSQTAVQSQIEKCINFLKVFTIISVLHQLRILLGFLKIAVRQGLYKIYNSKTGAACEMLAIIAQHSIGLLVESLQRKVLVLFVYLTFLLIFLQLGTCVFLMSKVFLPGGLIFLVTCLYLISHLNVSVLFHYLRRAESKLVAVQNERRPRKNFVLGKKTISNLNLF